MSSTIGTWSGRLMAGVLLCSLTACTNAMLSAAQRKLAAGQYADAQLDLAALLREPNHLSDNERRTALDGLCQAEFAIGAPTYSLSRQHRDCAAAASRPGSDSQARLEQIDAAIRHRSGAQIEAAIRKRDLEGAVVALLRYQQIEGSKDAAAIKWNRQIWRMVASSDTAGTRHSHRSAGLKMLVAEHPHLHRMSRQAFLRWLESAGAGEENLGMTDPAIKGKTLRLTVSDADLGQARFGPQTFARVNDAFSAWCRCYGDTFVASADTGLPVYLSRINRQTLRSEVLALPRR